MQYVYADNNASTRPAPEVIETMKLALDELHGNPSSVHILGRTVREKIDVAREQVAAMLSVKPAEILFTSGGTESNHLAVMGIPNARPENKHIITSQVEHLSVKSLFERLEKQGYEVTWLMADENGNLDLGELSSALRQDTALVSLITANHETGIVWPIAEAGALCREANVTFHTDAVMAAGWADNDMNERVDAATFSAHKFQGP
ncbi:MAG: aminotransferase class V-fold PLP-dependent enzyme, partial [Planctomycetota bacterium]|nr:aminotransferase class V-fold PLP-dependent enzyme [Planctomycetota bacterium]